MSSLYQYAKRQKVSHVARRTMNMVAPYANNWAIEQLKRKLGPRKKPGRAKKVSYGSRGTINAMAGKASIKTKGRKNVKSIVHRKRAVKVSRPLRKKIQKVIDGNPYKGTYTTTRFGTIGITSTNLGGTANTEDVTANMGGYTNELAFQKQNIDVSGSNRWWFAQALQSVKDSSTISLDQGSEWQFFSPLKILDAASVLWNNKVMTRDYRLQERNFNTVVQEATGLPVTGTVADPNVSGVKIQVNNSYVKFVMKNNGQRTMKITVYNCVPNIKFPGGLPLSSLRQGLIEEADGANTAYLAAVSPGFTNFQESAALFVNPLFEPSTCRAFHASWKYEKKIIRLSPGETMTHSVQGPKNYTLDYRKLHDARDNKQSMAYKGTTMAVMMSVEADLVFTTNNVTSVANEGGVTGHYVSGFSAKDSLVNPISIEWNEVYRLSMPDITGFTKNAIGANAGLGQVLNLRIPRRAFGNFTQSASSTTNPTHTSYDEVNPAAEIPEASAP